MDKEDSDLQAQLEEALHRSRAETTREESLLAEALAASLTTHDEELARSMQREQIELLERSLCEDVSRFPARQSHTSTPEWQKVSHHSRNNSSRPSSHLSPSSPPPSDHNFDHQTFTAEKRTIPYRDPLRAPTSRGKGSTSRRGGCSRGRDFCHKWRGKGRGHVLTSPLRNRGSTYADVASVASEHGTPSSLAPIVEGNDVEVVIDGQNVACAYGGGGGFKARGVLVVLEYYRQHGIKAVAVLPNNKVDERQTVGSGALNTLAADNPTLLLRLADEGRVAFTPAGAHDDYFVLSYAMRKGADVISNDRFQKELDLQETADDAWNLKTFLDEHLIPYTFVAGEFVPNPNPSQLGRSAHQSRAKR